MKMHTAQITVLQKGFCVLAALFSASCASTMSTPDDGFVLMAKMMDPLGIHRRASRDPFEQALKDHDLNSINRQIKRNPDLVQPGLFMRCCITGRHWRSFLSRAGLT
jgi:hypothetical protein